MQAKGDKLKNAITWVNEMRNLIPGENINKLTDEANVKFDLNPKESEFIINFFKEQKKSEEQE